MAKVRMYTTAVCPYCQMAERLLRAKGVADIDKVASISTRSNAAK